MTRERPGRQRHQVPEDGFALIAVIWVVLVVTMISMELVASIGLEARAASLRLDALRAEGLAKGAYQVALYLERIGLPDNDSAIMPPSVEWLRNREYRVNFSEGAALVRFETEGRISLSTAPEEQLSALFGLFRGDEQTGRTMAQSVIDWRDADGVDRSNNPEVLSYSDREYSPRNRTLGIGDPHLIDGFSFWDFQPTLMPGPNGPWLLPAGISSLATTTPRSGLDPNIAAIPVLMTLPEVTGDRALRIAALRDETPFSSLSDFVDRTRIEPDSPATRLLVFPGTVSVIEVESGVGNARTKIRWIYESVSEFNPLTGAFEGRRILREKDGDGSTAPLEVPGVR
jgi:type II secretory pathway component PulK